MSNPRFTIATAWNDYRAIVMPRNAGATQIQECRRAFYAGAESLMVQILNGLSPGPDAADADLDYINTLHQELIQFARDTAAGRV